MIINGRFRNKKFGWKGVFGGIGVMLMKEILVSGVVRSNRDYMGKLGDC